MAYLDTLPNWMTPGQFSLASQESAASIGRNFSAGMQIGQQAKQFKELEPTRKADITQKEAAAKANEADAALRNAQAQSIGKWMDDLKQAPGWMDSVNKAQTREELDAIPTPQFTSPKGLELYQDSVEKKRMDLHRSMIEPEAAEAGRLAAEIKVKEARDRMELRGIYGMPDGATPGQEMHARELRNIDKAKGIAAQIGVPLNAIDGLVDGSTTTTKFVEGDRISTTLPKLPNGDLNEREWQRMVAPYRIKPEQGMEESGVRIDSKGGVAKTFKAPENREKWVREKAAELVEKAGYDPVQARAKAEQLWDGQSAAPAPGAPGTRRIYQGGQLVPVK